MFKLVYCDIVRDMDYFEIEGLRRISGTVEVSGGKNAALPILFATLLTEDDCEIRNVPNLSDIVTTKKILEFTGAACDYNSKNHELKTSSKSITKLEAPYDLVKTMRASVLALGPILARFGEAKVSLPGGCAIGARPVNLHLEALKKMGAEIRIEGGYIFAKCKKLKGAEIYFNQVSVGATENTLMAAALADGVTTIKNAAMEPEIVDLVHFLRSMGSEIQGEGTATIVVVGKDKLHGAKHSVVGDRIEGGTLLTAAAITGGEVELLGLEGSLIQSVLDKFEETGCKVSTTGNTIRLTGPKLLNAVDIDTRPFPGFPTDMQAQFMALMTQANGLSRIAENIFENRFMHVSELIRLGADIAVNSNTAMVKGFGTTEKRLTGASVMATDLRASACLILAALAAKGKTEVHRIYHLDRGYEHLETKLNSLGAKITRLSE